LLRSALTVADQQGEVTNSLRAAAELALRSCQDGGAIGAIELARTTLEFLEGQQAYPLERGWMKARLANLREALQAVAGVEPVRLN
jgi:hypothetical protein